MFGVQQVVAERDCDVALSFHDCGAEVLVSGHDNEVGVVAESFKLLLFLLCDVDGVVLGALVVKGRSESGGKGFQAGFDGC